MPLECTLVLYMCLNKGVNLGIQLVLNKHVGKTEYKRALNRGYELNTKRVEEH